MILSVRTFRKAYDERIERCACSSGSRFADKMSVVVDNQGGRHLEKVGETDLYSLIQSHRDSVDLKKIIERVMQTGDVTLLQKAQGVYTDITGYPCDARTAQDLLNHAKFTYESLDGRLKALYSTFEDFLEAFATKENIELFAKNAQALNPSEEASEGGEVSES